MAMVTKNADYSEYYLQLNKTVILVAKILLLDGLDPYLLKSKDL